MQTEGNVDDVDVRKALGVVDLGALELRGGGAVAHVDPADGFVGKDEVHGRGLLGGDGEGLEAAQVRGLDALRVGDEEQGRPLHRLWTRGKDERTGEDDDRKGIARESHKKKTQCPIRPHVHGCLVQLNKMNVSTNLVYFIRI